MEDAKLKSRHIIDLRQSAAVEPAKARTARKTPVSKSSVSNKAVAAPVVERDLEPAALSTTGSSIPKMDSPGSTKAAQPAFSDPPPQRRFWPAFWRFLILIVVLGAVVTGGVYLYLKYYS